MPSPIGHTLAGLAVGWFAEPVADGTRPRWHAFRQPALTLFALGCAAAAALPDADLVLPRTHRTYSHSVTATVLILIIAAWVTRQVTGKINWRLAGALAFAQATHIIMDYLGADPFPPPGVQVFWPFDPRFFISPVEVFPGVERNFSKPEMLSVNAYAAVFEVLVMGPIAWAAWTLKRRRSRQAALQPGNSPHARGAQTGT